MTLFGPGVMELAKANNASDSNMLNVMVASRRSEESETTLHATCLYQYSNGTLLRLPTQTGLVNLP